MRTLAAPALLALLFAAPQDPAPPEAAEDVKVLLRGGTVLTMAGEPIPDGGVLINVTRGKIASVGRALPAPDKAQVIDCTGRFIVPGFIDAGTRVGLVDIDMVRSANDSDEGSEPSTPDVDVRDGVNVDSPVFGVTRSRGVTTVLVQPQGTNVINGRSALLHCLEGASVQERAVLLPGSDPPVPIAALHVSFGGNAKDRFAKKDKMPSTRMGVAAVLRREFEKAASYREKGRRFRDKSARWKAGHKDDEAEPEPPAVDRSMEILAKALSREIPVVAGADRLDDIRTALRIAEEFNLRLIISGGAESWKIARELADRKDKVSVIYGPVVRQPDSPETPGARMDAPLLLRQAGVSFCLATMDAHNSRNLPYHAGIAASWGLSEADALAAITRDAARILGCGDAMGTIEPGREATLCVFQGSPLEPLSRLERMFIRGKEVSLRNRQTELLEKWK